MVGAEFGLTFVYVPCCVDWYVAEDVTGAVLGSTCVAVVDVKWCWCTADVDEEGYSFSGLFLFADTTICDPCAWLAIVRY